MRKNFIAAVFLMLAFSVTACSQNNAAPIAKEAATKESQMTTNTQGNSDMPKNFVQIPGGSFAMGSPQNENWRSGDENQHTVAVDSFYIGAYEVTNEEYQAVMGAVPSFFKDAKLPVENVSWLDAIIFCNEKSKNENRKPAYVVDGVKVTWDKSANGYRLPTEAEWEYAARGGTTTPFNTENSISPEEANYYGHYPYGIEENYFTQEKLPTQPGRARQTTVAVDSFSPNKFGLYNAHGNVCEWVWDWYGDYNTATTQNPTGPETGNFKVYRGGGWFDFAKHLRSAYRAILPQDKIGPNVGFRLALNSAEAAGAVVSAPINAEKPATKGKVLVVYYSWSGNTERMAEKIRQQTNGDIFKLVMEKPYSSSYQNVLNQSQADQHVQARPALVGNVANIGQYDIIMIGYPNWWASIPMPVATFLDQYDLSGKTIITFTSNGGGSIGQSVTAIAKAEPNAKIGHPLSVHYSGGNSLDSEISQWLKSNGM